MKNLKFSLIDILNIFFVFIIFLFYLSAFKVSPYKTQPSLIFTFLIGLILFSAFLRNSNHLTKAKKIFLFSYPVIFLFTMFETFYMILPYFNPHTYDNLLNNIDFKLLGTYPTIWIEQFHNPFFTDILYLLYLFYFPMPLFLLIYLYNKKKHFTLDKIVTTYLTTYYTSYIIYFFIPAMGPRFNETLIQLQHFKHLNGVIFAIPIRELINYLEPNKFDAFPSLHSAIVTTTMLSTYYYNKKLFKIFLPIAIGIFIALVYCRYHYVIDIIVGFILSVSIFYIWHYFYDKIRIKTKTVDFTK